MSVVHKRLVLAYCKTHQQAGLAPMPAQCNFRLLAAGVIRRAGFSGGILLIHGEVGIKAGWLYSEAISFSRAGVWRMLRR